MISKHHQHSKHQSYYDNLSKWFCSSFLGSKILTYIQCLLLKAFKFNKSIHFLVDMDPPTGYGRLDSRRRTPCQNNNSSPIQLRLNAAAERRNMMDQLRNNNNNSNNNNINNNNNTNLAILPAVLGGGFRVESYRPPNMPFPQRVRPLTKSSPGRIPTMASSNRDASKSPLRDRIIVSSCHHTIHKHKKPKSKSNSSGKQCKVHDLTVSNTDTESKPRVKKKNIRKPTTRSKGTEVNTPVCLQNVGQNTVTTAKSMTGKMPQNDCRAVLHSIGVCLDSLRKHRCLSHPRMSSCPYRNADKPFCVPSYGSNRLIEIKKPLVITTPITHIETKWRHRRSSSETPPTKIEAGAPDQISLSSNLQKDSGEIKTENNDKDDCNGDGRKESKRNQLEKEAQDHQSSENKEMGSPTDSLTSSSAGSTLISSSPMCDPYNSTQLTDSGPSSSSHTSNLEQTDADPPEKPEEDEKCVVEYPVVVKRSDPQISTSMSHEKNSLFGSRASIASDSSTKRRPTVRLRDFTSTKIPPHPAPTTQAKCPAVNFTTENRVQGLSGTNTKISLDKASTQKYYSQPDLQYTSQLQGRLSSQHSSAPSTRPVTRQSAQLAPNQFHSMKQSQYAGDESSPYPSNQQDPLLHQKDQYPPDHLKKQQPDELGQYQQDPEVTDLSDQLDQFLPGQEVEYVSDQYGAYTSDQPGQYTTDEVQYESEQPNQYEADQYGQYPVQQTPEPTQEIANHSDQNQSDQEHKVDVQVPIPQLPTQGSALGQEGRHRSQDQHCHHTSYPTGTPLLQGKKKGQLRHSGQAGQAKPKRRVSYEESRVPEHLSVPYRRPNRTPADIKSTSIDSVTQERFDDTSIQSSLSSISSDTSMSELVSRLTTLSTQTKLPFVGADYERSNMPFGTEFNVSRDANVRVSRSPTGQKPSLPMRPGSSMTPVSNNHPGMKNFNMPHGSAKQQYSHFPGNLNIPVKSMNQMQHGLSPQNLPAGYSFSPFQYNRNTRPNSLRDQPLPSFNQQGDRQRRSFSPFSVQRNVNENSPRNFSPQRSGSPGGFSISKANSDGFTLKFPKFLAAPEFSNLAKQPGDRNSTVRPEMRAPGMTKIYDTGGIKLPPVSNTQYMKYSALPTYSQGTLSFDPSSSSQVSDNNMLYPSTSNDFDYSESDVGKVHNNAPNGPSPCKSKTWIPNTTTGNSSAQTPGTFPKIAPGIFPGMPPGIHPGLMAGLPGVTGMPGMSGLPGVTGLPGMAGLPPGMAGLSGVTGLPGMPSVPGGMYAGIMPMYSGMYPGIIMYPGGMPPMPVHAPWHSGKSQPMGPASAAATAPSCLPTSAVMFPYFPYSMPMIPWNLQMGVPNHPSYPNMPIMTFDPCQCGMNPNMCTVPQSAPDVKSKRPTPPATPTMPGVPNITRNCTIPENSEPANCRSNGACNTRLPLRFQPYLRKDK